VIEAVIWDFGGVFTTSPFEAFARYERERGIPYAGNFGPLPVEGSKPLARIRKKRYLRVVRGERENRGLLGGAK
jgi:hypothetical protein